MNKISEIQKPAVVFVGSYTRANIRGALLRPLIGKVHFLISDWTIYPRNQDRYRVELQLRKKTEKRDFVRRANLLELVHFAILHPELLVKCGPIEGADEHLQEMGKSLGIPLVVPYVTLRNDKIWVSLDDERCADECEYKLVVTQWLNYSH